jgi:subtilisin family serine protease
MAVFGLVAAKSERYIIQYDEQAWNSMSLKYLPTDTKYILKALRMQVADLDMDEIREFSNLPGVTLHKDGVARIVDFGTNDVQKDPPSWGIDRIDQRALPLDKAYNWDSTGKGVDVWIVDTGVNAQHQEFAGRATFDKNFAEDGEDTDCHGHGTHVSSTIGGKTVGVAKEVTIHGVKVLSCSGSGSWSGVIAGINYVVEESKKGNKKSVINMSLGGPKNEAVNAAVKAATAGGVTVVVAAGNESQNASNVSPASAPEAITVAASDITDTHAYFSNYGPNVAVYAPGVNIKGAWIGGTDRFNTISGTSMASPHTAGVAALIIARGEASNPAEVKARLQAAATKDVIKGVKPQTKNLLLYSLKASGVATYDSYSTSDVMNLVK